MLDRPFELIIPLIFYDTLKLRGAYAVGAGCAGAISSASASAFATSTGRSSR